MINGNLTYTDGLLAGQQMANAASHAAFNAGDIAVANAMAELSTDLLLLREGWEREVKRTAT